METSQLKKFAQFARRNLIEQVSAKLKLVLSENSAARRESVDAVKKLDKQIKLHGQEQVIEKVAYTWFNRFCALRFMDVNRYTRIGVVSPAEGQSQPEILAEAKMGYIDDGMVPEKTQQQIFALLDGSAPSQDPQSEAYRLLIVAICNYWYKAMPFLFERINDYTELLMPSDLLSGNSILSSTREAMTPDACQDVEVIGWLYQFYISEKKDEVFAGLKKNRKITPENIPAATQLFTPHWIVRYLVENSLGRLWMLNHPNSKLIEQMDYYIKPEQSETDFLSISKPEELKICDPACGSGHMLTYAFDLLYAIYEEEGYEPSVIPEKILTHNLYGIEIDERAGELAAFALTMKARSKQRRFFRKKIQPNICVLENIRFESEELNEYMDFIGRDLFTAPLQTTLRQFEETDNFGSLICPEVTNVEGMLEILEAKDVSGQLFLSSTHQKVLQALKQADYLSPKYHVVIANPPYMGGKGMNGRLKKWATENYQNSKSDLFAMFIERNLELARKRGLVAMITMQSWMFLSSFETLRSSLLSNYSIISMAHLGARAFDSIGGEVVQTTAFVLDRENRPDYKGSYLRLLEGRNESEKQRFFKENRDGGVNLFRSPSQVFKELPGKTIAYWVSSEFISAFEHKKLGGIAEIKSGIMTGNDELFLRKWYEISIRNTRFRLSDESQLDHIDQKWLPMNKGDGFQKWFPDLSYVMNFKNRAEDLRKLKGIQNFRLRDSKYYFKVGITWSDVGSNVPSFRYQESGLLFSARSPMIFIEDYWVLGLLNSSVVSEIIELLNPTLTINLNEVEKIPIIKEKTKINEATNLIRENVLLVKSYFEKKETNWDFQKTPLVGGDDSIEVLCLNLYENIKNEIIKLVNNEADLDRIYRSVYGLNEKTFCGWEYPSIYNEEVIDFSSWPNIEINSQEIIQQFISYAVGCMFGRYSLDAPGLILANQGETIDDYYKKLEEPQINTDRHRLEKTKDNICVNPCPSVVQNLFPADEDNVIPILDGDWFTDDITERFFKFLRVTFGEEHYEENLDFIESAIGKSIRNYFLKHFYNDHVKRYKKRPIYWLFSSPKGSFNALIYMHRYRSDTVSVVLNDYLREFRTKLASRKNQLEALSISASAKKIEKTRALKEIEKINKMIDELDEYEREVLYPLATEQVEIDLDDGVKVNYNKFGKALKKIPGLTAKGN